jgi:hypothetical protein
MARWNELVDDEPELAKSAAARLAGGVAYLATTAHDGAPRVHPVTPIVGSGSLFVFMEPMSPKDTISGATGDSRSTRRSTTRRAPEVSS